MGLSEVERGRIKEMIDRCEPLPIEYRSKLFTPETAHSSVDERSQSRQQTFEKDFLEMSGMIWTNFHFVPEGSPPANMQMAWPWRREIWYSYHLCRRAIGRAYRRYDSGEHANWNEASRMLERLYHIVAALTFHNGMEDRIAQLANALGALGMDEGKVSFDNLFKKPGPAALSQTWIKVAQVKADSNWQETHSLANEVKHRWTGKFVDHEPQPRKVLDDLKSSGATYICYGLVEYDPANVDRICGAIQKSLNLLVELATILDGEAKWESFFKISIPEKPE